MMRDQRGTENLPCLSDPESVSLLHMANIDLYAAACDWISVSTAPVCGGLLPFTAPDGLHRCHL